MIKTAIIEDEEKAYETLKEYLLSFGKENQIDFSITHYSEGLSFLEECTGFDLVFMDIVMPEKDGNAALSEIREFDKDATIIIVSSVGTQEQLQKAIQLGAKDFIQKPFEKNQIKEIIELRLGGKN